MTEEKKSKFGKGIDLVSSALEHIVPKGGIKHPDSVITRGANRSLYISGKSAPSPVPGSRPVMGKDLLIKGHKGIKSAPPKRLRLW